MIQVVVFCGVRARYPQILEIRACRIKTQDSIRPLDSVLYDKFIRQTRIEEEAQVVTDYSRISEQNEDDYRITIQRMGRLLFQDIYSTRTHFIYELLQNAEDALGRRDPAAEIRRAVNFDLKRDRLRVNHFGDPFNEEDVRGISTIVQSTKRVTDIGRFGIGFKSVYAYTDRPEVHSGPEDFSIVDYLWPEAVPPIDRDPEETVFLFPFKDNRESSYGEIAAGLEELGPEVLLFLRQIDNVTWTTEEGVNGKYSRVEERFADSIRRVSLVDHRPTRSDQKESNATEYLVFSRPVEVGGSAGAGFVEVAFRLSDDGKRVRRIGNSNLVVFFPTVVPTDLGFLVQGPYRTTPTRETVPVDEPWNQYLVRETGELLVDALRWFRDQNLLDPKLLECLPLERRSNLLEPLFDVTREALASEELLPGGDGDYVRGRQALMARGRGMVKLLDPDRLPHVFRGKSAWLSDRITQDRSPVLVQYLRDKIEIDLVTPESVVRRLTRPFLENQPDEWLVQLYEFLHSRRRTLKYILPHRYLIRLADGTHVTAREPDVFLPGDGPTDCRIVKKSVCETIESRQFLKWLGLREVDFMDDLINNILPIYDEKDLTVNEATITKYSIHLDRILDVYSKANREQRLRLIRSLKKTKFIMSIDYTEETRSFRKPCQVYFPNERLRLLFDGVERIHFIDSTIFPLDEQRVTELLSGCAVSDSMRPMIPAKRQSITHHKLKQLRGNVSTNRKEDKIIDWELDSIGRVIQGLSDRPIENRQLTSIELWNELTLATKHSLKSYEGWNPLTGRRTSLGRLLSSKNVLYGKYEWFYYRYHSTEFPSTLANQLNNEAWIADTLGELHSPSEVVFDDLGWESDAELLSVISFKTPKPIPEVPKPGELTDYEKQLSTQVGIEAKSIILFKKLKDVGYSNDAINQHLEEMILEPTDTGTRDEASNYTTHTKPDVPYSEALASVMTVHAVGESPEKPARLPEGGPRTVTSAVEDTARSSAYGRSGRYRTVVTTSFGLSAKAKKLRQKFRSMAGGDYDGRCQICGRAFLKPDNGSQTFITHMVAPTGHRMSNHYGNLLSLCGWHHALIRWGRWSPIDAEGSSVTDLRDAATEMVDDDGNSYIDVPVRFMGVYLPWRPDAENRDHVIRFNKPHWEYHLQLLEPGDRS